MKSVKLSNGLRIIHDYRKSNSTVIQVNIGVGSNYETKRNLGICHFMEHMLFEGTKKRDARQIALEVESMGGEINAFTGNERTGFYVSVLNKHVGKGLDVLNDMLRNPLFKKKAIEKEKKIVMDEKKIFFDDPNTYQWLLFLKNLYRKHPTKYDGFGNSETIGSLKRKDVVKFHQNYYKPNNMSVVVVGGNKKIVPKIRKTFSDFKPGKVQKYKKIKEPLTKRKKVVSVYRDVEHSYYVLGYKTVTRNNNNCYVLDLISFILGHGQSSRLFNEMRIKRGIGYNVGVLNDMNKDYGYFASYVTTDNKNVKEVRKIVNNQMSLKDLNGEEIKRAKDMIEGSILIKNENNKERSDWISYWDLIGDFRKADSYINNIKRIKKEDIKRVIKKYFTGNFVEAVIREK